MSTQSTITIGEDEMSPKARQLVEYLQAEVKDSGGEMYIKGKFISDEVGLSTKEIGALMHQLQGVVRDLEIEKWSYTNATTWRITN